MATERLQGWSPPATAAISDEECDADVSSGSTISDLDDSDNEISTASTKSPFTGKAVDKGKKVVGKHGIKILPAEILETILYTVDPETFASLILVNRAWREASQSPHLYAHQLSWCPSYILSPAAPQDGPLLEEDLARLKRRFAQEVKRGLFEAFVQPKRTTLSIVSTTTSSSAAFPRGEAFDFTFSPDGHWTLALSSSRIYVLDTLSSRISVKREFKVLRKPVCAAILDGAQTLVVLSSHNINIYDISNHQTKHKRSIPLDSSPHAMAVSPKGEILAIACMAGVELHALAPNVGEVDRRSVRCDRVDSLAFSKDGTMILGTTRHSHNPYTVVLTAPYAMDENLDLPASETISHMWTSQIIIPHSSRDCSHSTLLSNRTDGDASWTFTFDRMFESFRAVRTDDLRNGTTYFTGPKRRRRSSSKASRHKLMPCTLPSPTRNGELVASGFYGKDVWIYGVPEGLDSPMIHQPDEVHSNTSAPSTPVSAPRTPTRTLSRGETSNVSRVPRWDALLDKYRNVFVKGKRVAEISGITSTTWVETSREASMLRERLLVAAPGGVHRDIELGQEDFAGADGGRLMILDFDKTFTEAPLESVVLEVGTNDPELLEEEDVDIEKEVELVRRRTRRDARPITTIGDALNPSAPKVPPMPPAPTALANMHYLPVASTLNSVSPISPPVAEVASHPSVPGMRTGGGSAALEGQQPRTQPRSEQPVHRSATTMAVNRERNQPRMVQNAVVEYRRPGGRGQMPDESDADHWVPPPPPYQPKADTPLPEHLQRTLLPSPAEPARRLRNTLRRPQRANTMFESGTSRSAAPPTDHQETRSQMMTLRSVSESLDVLSRSVGQAVPPPNAAAESSHSSRRPSSSRRRPVSAYVGKVANSLRRKSNPRVQTVSSNDFNDIPPVPTRPLTSITAPTSPTRSRSHSRSRSGSASPPRNRHRREPSSAGPSDIPQIPSMPSAEQLANFSNRFKQPPPRPIQRKPIPPSLITSGDRIPAPPPGALGAAGSPSSALLRQSPTSAQSSTQSPSTSTTTPSSARRASAGLSNDRAARSSPSLLRPAAQRLDTIDSISSHVSASRTKSAGQQEKRSASMGPALRLDRVGTMGGDGKKKSGFFTLARSMGRRKESLGVGRNGNGREDDGRGGEGREKKDNCKVM